MSEELNEAKLKKATKRSSTIFNELCNELHYGLNFNLTLVDEIMHSTGFAEKMELFLTKCKRERLGDN